MPGSSKIAPDTVAGPQSKRDLISELLSFQNTGDKAQLEAVACGLYDSIFKSVGTEGVAFAQVENASGAGLAAASELLEKVLLEMLRQSNLDLADEGQYKRIWEAFLKWPFKNPMEMDDIDLNDSIQLVQFKRIGQLYNLRERLGAIIREEGARQALCRQFQRWDEYLANEQKKNPQDHMLQDKRGAVAEVLETLNTNDSQGVKRVNVHEQLDKCKGKFKEKRKLLVARRDSPEWFFLKAILTLISAGSAFLFGLWTKEGEKRSKSIDIIFQKHQDPEGAPVKKVKAKR